MANKKAPVPDLSQLFGNARPYDAKPDAAAGGPAAVQTRLETSGKPARLALARLRLDPGQPRKLLPPHLAERVHSGEMDLPEALASWASALNIPLQARYDPDSEGTGEGTAARFNRIRQLAATILSDGLINPITAIEEGQGFYRVETGERRTLAHAWLAACGLAEYETIPAWIVDGAIRKRARQMVENLNRDDLSAYEKAVGLWNLRFELSGRPAPDTAAAETAGSVLSAAEGGLVDWTMVEQQVGRTRQWRQLHTRLLELSPAALKLIAANGLPERPLRPIYTRLREDAKGQVFVLERALAENGAEVTSERMEEIAQMYQTMGTAEAAQRRERWASGKAPAGRDALALDRHRAIRNTKRALKLLRNPLGSDPSAAIPRQTDALAALLADDPEVGLLAGEVVELVTLLAGQTSATKTGEGKGRTRRNG